MSFCWNTYQNRKRLGVNDCAYISENYFNGLFKFIKWDDEEPWQLDDLKKLEICE